MPAHHLYNSSYHLMKVVLIVFSFNIAHLIPLFSSTDPVIKPLDVPHTLGMHSRGQILLA